VACSLNATNPGLPLLVMTVEGDLSPGVAAAAAQVATLVHVPDLMFPNTMRDGRCGSNGQWQKTLLVPLGSDGLCDVICDSIPCTCMHTHAHTLPMHAQGGGSRSWSSGMTGARRRYALNWLKIRAWEWEDWDALLLIDADTTVTGARH